MQWWLNDTILDSVVDSKSGESHTVNQLLTKVTRSLKGQKLQCRASSSEIAGDIVREVPINVYCKSHVPMKIYIYVYFFLTTLLVTFFILYPHKSLIERRSLQYKLITYSLKSFTSSTFFSRYLFYFSCLILNLQINRFTSSNVYEG